MSANRTARPGIVVRCSIPILVMTASLVGLPIAPAQSTAPEPAEVTALRAGIGALAQVFLPEYGEVGPFAKPLPMTDTSAGAEVVRPGDTLDLSTVLKQGITDKLIDLQTSSPASTVAEFLEQLDTELDGTVAGVDLAVAVTNPDMTPDPGFDLSITASRTAQAAVALTDPDGPGGIPFTLRTPPTAPFDIAFGFTAGVRVNTAGDRFWLVADTSGPAVQLKAELAGDDVYTFPEGEAAIGVGDVDVLAGSTSDLDATWSGTIADSNLDGRLAMFEPTLDGTGMTPGELTMPAESLTTLAASGSATASVKLGSAMIPLDSDPAPTMTLDADLTTALDLESDLVGSSGDLADMAAFTRISAVDLVSGLTQYSTLLRSLQRHPNVDATLPLAGGRLSDLHDLGAQVATLADSLITITPSTEDPDPTDDQIPQTVEVGIQTIEDLADKIDSLPGFSGGPLQPTYDSATQRVTMNVAFNQTPDGLATLTLPSGSEVAQLTFGDQLKSDTGLRGVTRPGNTPVAPQVDVGYQIDLPILIDLAPSEPVAVDNPDTPAVEFEYPMVYERFQTSLKADAEIRLTTLVDSGAQGVGQIGIVPAVVGGTYKLKQDGSNPTTVADVDAGAGNTATPRLTDLMAGLHPQGGNPAKYPVAQAERHVVVDADLTVNGHGARAQDVLTAEPGTMTVDGTGFDPATYTAAQTNDAAKLLRALDVDDGTPTRLLGRIFDTAGEVAETVEAVDGALGTDAPSIPLIKKGAGALLEASLKLEERIAALRSGATPLDLGKLEIEMQKLFGQADSHDLIGFKLLDVDDSAAVDPALVLRFNLNRSENVDVPLTINASGLPSLAGSGDDGKVEVGMAGTLNLGVLVPLNQQGTSAPPLRVLDGSEFTASGTVSENPPGSAQLKVQVGSLSAQLGDSTNKTGRLALGAKLSLGVPSAPDPGSTDEEPVSLTQYFDDLDVTFGPTTPGGFTCNPDTDPDNPPDLPSNTGAIGCAVLPVLADLGTGLKTLGGNDPTAPEAGDYLMVSIDDQLDADVDPPANLAGVMSSMDFSFDGLGDGFASLARLLEVAIAASSIGSKLPLVGEDLSAVADGLTQLKAFLDNPAAALNLPTGTVQQVLLDDGGLRDLLTEAFGPTGLNILRDGAYQPFFAGDPDAAAAQDIRIVAVCVDGAACELSDPATQIKDVRVEMELGQGSRGGDAPGQCTGGNGTPCPGEVGLPIDLGLPGLPLSLTGESTAKAGWTLELGFGLSRDDGFYLLDNPVPGTNQADSAADDGAQEIRVNAGIDLFSASVPKLTGQIGFISMEAENHPGKQSGAKLLAQVGLDAPGDCATQVAPYTVGVVGTQCTGKILGTQLISSAPTDYLTNAKIEGAVDIDADLRTGIGTGTVDQTMPSFTTEFVLKWSFGTGGTTDPTISLLNIGVDPGQLIRKVFGQVLEEINTILEPTEEVRDFLFTPIPVISDISEFFDQGTIAMIDIARLFGVADTALLKDIDAVLDVVEKIADLANGGSFVLVEDLKIEPDVAQGAPRAPDQVNTLWDDTQVFNAIADLEGEIADIMPDELADAWQSLGEAVGATDEPDFTYPMFEQPECLTGLLLGNDCSIVEWRPDDLHVEASYPLSFGPFFGVLYVTFSGEIEANANLGAGVSTRGIRMLAEDLINGDALDASRVGKVFLQSLFLLDYDRDGKDVPEFEVAGTIKAGAKFDALIVSAGIDGGITATFSMNLNDTPEKDGRMHIDEIIDKIKTPICLFNLHGKLVAFLEVWAKFGICPFCHTETWRLAEVTLFEWSNKCEPEPPNLADTDAAGVVRLNVGNRAPNRNTLTEITAESYVVKQLTKEPDAGGNHKFRVSAFGYNEEETGKEILVEDAQGDNDSFQFIGSGQISADEDLQTGPGDTQTGSWPFTAKVTANLGADQDTYKGSTGPDTVQGNAGDDVINLGNGTNTGWGDTPGNLGHTGNDTVIGGQGKDEIHGGPLNDVIEGGIDEDKLFGGGGIDKIHGGQDILTVPPGKTPPPGAPANQYDAADLIVGGAGNDTLSGGAGDDRIHGDEQVVGHEVSEDYEGEATVDGEAPGNDLIEGGAGADKVWGGRGNDTIQGGYILAADGKDLSADELQGNGGDDRIHGSFGNDKIYGGPHSDRTFGEDDDDEAFGQSGNDPEVRGGPGADKLWGGGGDDAIFGDAGADEIIGDGDGAVLGGSDAAKKVGNDTTDGGNGNDIVLGDNGTVSGPIGSRVANPSQDDGAADGSLGGGEGDDQIYGEGGGDTLFGGGGRDLLHGNGGEDTVHGETGADEAWGDTASDTLYGGTEDDVVFGNGADDKVHGQEGADLLVGGHADPTGADTGDRLFGGPENDRIYGDDVTIVKGANNLFDASDEVSFTPSADPSTYGDDVADGGTGMDEIHGQDGEDELWGAEDHDQIFGELGSDELHGEGGPDFLVGDRGTIQPGPREVVAPDGGWKPGTPQGAPVLDVSLVAPDDGSVDLIWGDFDSPDDAWASGGDDHAWGGVGNDVMRGGSYDDTMEGNNGKDRMFGFDEDSDHETDGEDDLIGGSSPVNPLADPEGANNASDEGETEMQGNGQEDVMTGDNAVVSRVADDDDPTKWKVDPVTGGVFRALVLLDTEKTGAALDAVSGGDFMVGNDENDRMFGEGGTDLVKGNAHDDLVEGNQDGDWLEGNNDEDDLVGGSSFPDQPDSGDVLWGGGGADVLAGDNTCLVRQTEGVPFEPESCEQLGSPAPTAFHYVTSQLGVQTPRGVVIHDLDTPVTSEYGNDQLNGGQGVDVEFGQDGTDFLFGDGGGDFQFGNGHEDVVIGDRSVSAYSGISLPPEVGGTLPSVPPVPSGLPGTASTGEQLVGPAQADGQDDQTGGSNRAAARDDGDWIFGDGEADFQLGDNGELNRTVEGDSYAVYEERYPGNNPPDDGSAVIERDVTRYDVNASAAAGVWGADLIFGGDGTNPLISEGAGDGHDSQWGQDGNDKLFGEDGDDDQYGELGDDTMWGGAGEDAMVGDRGGVQTRYVEDDGSDSGDPEVLTHNSLGPPGINLGGPLSGPQDATLKPFTAHPLDRRTSLSHDRDGSALPLGGHVAGGADQMRGGPGHDSIHGADGNDLVNGDSGGDYVYGDDGADVMWGGRGRKEVLSPDFPSRNAMGTNGEWIDIMFGGYGSSNTEAGADILDYQPRPGIDPAVWFTMVEGYADTSPGNAGVEGRQHHHGTDWLYGGWDRDVLQGDVAANGPNDGDKLIDWNGAYNLYTHCNAAYGGWNDVRKIDPNNIEGLNRLAYVTGATADFTGRPVLTDVTTPGTSAFQEAAIVYSKDVKDNSGKAFSTTPGHFQDFICDTD